MLQRERMGYKVQVKYHLYSNFFHHGGEAGGGGEEGVEAGKMLHFTLFWTHNVSIKV